MFDIKGQGTSFPKPGAHPYVFCSDLLSATSKSACLFLLTQVSDTPLVGCLLCKCLLPSCRMSLHVMLLFFFLAMQKETTLHELCFLFFPRPFSLGNKE